MLQPHQWAAVSWPDFVSNTENNRDRPANHRGLYLGAGEILLLCFGLASLSVALSSFWAVSVGCGRAVQYRAVLCFIQTSACCSPAPHGTVQLPLGWTPHSSRPRVPSENRAVLIISSICLWGACFQLPRLLLYFHELWACCPWMGMQEKICSACMIILYNKLRWHGKAVCSFLKVSTGIYIRGSSCSASQLIPGVVTSPLLKSLQDTSTRFRLGWFLFCCGFCVCEFWFGVFFCENILIYHQLLPHYILGFLQSNHASCWSLWSFHWNCCHSSCNFHCCVRRWYSCR